MTNPALNRRNPTVLVIDDDAHNLAIVSEYLEELRYSVLVAEDGESGIQRAEYAQPDLVLLDVLMPGIDGFETCRRLNASQKTSGIPVIFMTALADEEHKAAGFEAGGVDYVTKPFHRKELLARVRAHLALLRTRQALELAQQDLERKVSERTLQLETSLREQETLLRELYHRTKNNMQVIISLLDLQAARIQNPRVIEIFNDTKSRIRSMAIVHEKLYRSRDLSKVDLKGYIEELALPILRTYQPERREISLKLDVEDIGLSINVVTPLGLILNELISNSMKYAFPDSLGGEIQIRVHRVEDREIELVYSDNGIGLPPGFDIRKARSLGMKLVHSLATIQLQGQFLVHSEPGRGVEFILRFKAIEERKILAA